MMMRDKPRPYRFLGFHLASVSAYSFDCTFFRLSCLTAKALRRTTMRGSLVGAAKPEKSTLKQVQLRFLGLIVTSQKLFRLWFLLFQADFSDEGQTDT